MGEGGETRLDIGMVGWEKGRRECTGVITHKGVKRRDVGGRMFAIVMRKFSSGEIGNPVVLAYRSIGAEELFQTLVNTFSLAIRLRVISGGHGLGDTEGVTEGTREGGSELGS